MSQVLSEIKVIDDLKDIVGDVVTKKAKTKHMLEEQIRDIAPIEFEEETDEKINAEILRAVVVLSQMNLHIWHNESNYRKGIKDGNDLELTHGLNVIRNTAKNKIQEIAGGRKDYKIDCLAAEFKDWEISWRNNGEG